MRNRCLLLLSFAALPLAAQGRADPHPLVDSAIAAMGGRALLASLTSMRIDGMQHEYVLGNAERSEGPWRTQYARFSDLWDISHQSFRRTSTSPAAATPTPLITIVNDSVIAMQAGPRLVGGYGGFLEDYRDRMQGAPSQVLLAASAAASLRSAGTIVRFSVPQDVVEFRTPDGPVRIELDRRSHLPTAVEITRHPALEVRRAIFGDAMMRIEYVDWTAEPNGLWWPHQHRFLFNGEMFRDLSITKLEPNATVAADSFAIADSTRRDYATALSHSAPNFNLGDRPEPMQPGDDIARLADNWAMTLVKQPDGVVVFEAHLSDRYIKQVVAEVHRRWPGAPIKAFVLTSDPWAHLGGLREVVSMGLPIYVNSGSIPFLTMLTKRPWTLAPDDLAKAPKLPRFIGVSAKTAIGTGHNRIELYPVGGAYSERMTMAYFPERRLLYGADLVFPTRAPAGATAGTPAAKTFLRTEAIELHRAVDREHLAVDSLFCVQAPYPIFKWSDFIPAGN